ncbi:MAG: hypothetical protein IT162_06965 [Bryobacterales bacterium]|nr:hypothetical protein [Bryobacterales bacterium]
MRVCYIARGRGRGHALAAVAIAEELRRRRPGVPIQFVSYGTGAATFGELGYAVTDLHLPDRPGLFEVENALPRLWEQSPPPALVVAHEEFAVCPVAHAFGIPAVLATDWLLNDPGVWQTESLQQTSEVLFLDDEQVFTDGLFVRPAYAARKIHCVGPVLRPRRYQRPDRFRARREAGWPPDALVIAVFIHPGRRTEVVAPLRELLHAACDLLPASPRPLLLWDRDGDAEFDRTMAACDLAITKGNRNLVLELAALGVPAVSFSHGLNHLDDLRTGLLANNRTVAYAALTPRRLADVMLELLAADRGGAIQPVPYRDGARGAAVRLAARLNNAGTAGSER